MFNDQDSLLDVIHSIPASCHSVAHATRRPTAGYTEQAKYIPDFGGILETPMTNLKSRSLKAEMPFKPNPPHLSIRVSNKYTSQRKPTTEDCLVASSYLEHVPKTEKITIIRAIGSHLHVDLMNKTTQVNDIAYGPKCYGHVPYSEMITGIKLAQNLDDLLLVKFDQGIKIIKLNKSYRMPEYDSDSDISSDDLSSVDNEPALIFLKTFHERIGLQVKDSCINPFTKSILSVVSESIESRIVKLYDLSSGQHNSYHSIFWANDDSNTIQTQPPISDSGDTTTRILRRRIVRSYQPVRPVMEGIKQLDHIPSHLTCMLLSDERQVMLIDPRLDKPGQMYVDKAKISSFYPIEYLRRFQFSTKNSYQFYSLSNIHLRVFDTRYPYQPMSQINHMLDSETYDVMNMKIIPYNETRIETVCSSSLGRLSFVTFDHERAERLANPSSPHHPFHDPGPAELSNDDSDELFGLAVVPEQSQNAGSCLFSVIQLSALGTISYRRFESSDCEMEPDLADGKNRPVSLIRGVNAGPIAQADDECDSDSTEADIYNTETEIDDSCEGSDSDTEINILDQSDSTDLDPELESEAVKKAYRNMKTRMGVGE